MVDTEDAWEIAVWCPESETFRPPAANAAFDVLMVEASLTVDATMQGINDRFEIEHGSGRWDCDPFLGTLRFTTSEGRVCEGPFDRLGTWSVERKTFRLGWDHPFATPPIRGGAERVLAKGEEIVAEVLTTRYLRLGQDEVEHLAKLTAFLSDLPAVYRGWADENLILYMAFAEPSWRDA
ncbi:MAG: DUF6882 domain-containing protein [Pseudomonadota bacterium]